MGRDKRGGLQTHQAWPSPAVGPEPKQGRLGIGWLQNKTLLVPSASVLGSQRLSGTSPGYRKHSTLLGGFLWWPSSVPDNGAGDQQQISSSNIPGNQLDQSGHQPLIPLRLHLGRWGRLCATMGFGSDEIAPAIRAFCRLFSLSLVLGISSKHGVAGAEGAAMSIHRRVRTKPDGARTRWTERQRAASRLAVARK
jgi:hypothetical protein